jgi:hypothetical protein
MLEVNDLKESVEDVVPIMINPVDLEFHKKREVKDKWVLLESMKDHLIPHIFEKENAKDMYDVFMGLYQNKNTEMILHLKHQLQIIRMTNEDIVISYLINVT